jgi:hypothetical protein
MFLRFSLLSAVLIMTWFPSVSTYVGVTVPARQASVLSEIGRLLSRKGLLIGV